MRLYLINYNMEKTKQKDKTEYTIIIQALKEAEQNGTQADSEFIDGLINELDIIENGEN